MAVSAAVEAFIGADKPFDDIFLLRRTTGIAIETGNRPGPIYAVRFSRGRWFWDSERPHGAGQGVGEGGAGWYPEVMTRFAADRPFAEPEKAARKIPEIANATEAVQDG